MGPAEPQTLLQVVDTLDLHGTPASPALPRLRSPCDVSALRRPSFRLEVSQADCCLIASQPAGTGEALADRQCCDRNLSDRKVSALSNAVYGNVVRLIDRELFDLKARGDIFFESPSITNLPLGR